MALRMQEATNVRKDGIELAQDKAIAAHKDLELDTKANIREDFKTLLDSDVWTGGEGPPKDEDR